MKKLIALIIALVLALAALPAFALDTEDIIRKAEEALLPCGSTLKTLHELENAEGMSTAEKYARTIGAMLSDAAGAMVFPGTKALFNHITQKAIGKMAEEGQLDRPLRNVSENDKTKMDMYLKAAGQAVDHMTEKVTDAAKTAWNAVTGTAEKARDSLKYIWNAVTGW